MRNLIKYPPLEWRKNYEFCTPQGPFPSWAPTEQMLLAGSKLSFKAPRHSPKRSIIKQKQVYPGYDILAASDSRLHRDLNMPNDCWGVACMISRAWAFYGPWMTGCKGELFFSVAVVERFRECAFQNVSFFNPKAFEMVLVHYLNDRYGHEHWEGEDAHIPLYYGPVDWQRHKHLPVPSASFKISRGSDPVKLVRPEYHFVFPITDNHFVQICFDQSFYSVDSSGSSTFDTLPFQELQDQVFNSITLKLGRETQASYDKVKAEVGNMQLCKEFAPLKWPTNIYPPLSDTQQEIPQAQISDT